MTNAEFRNKRGPRITPIDANEDLKKKNDECPMSNAEGMKKSECPKIRLVPLPFSIRASFVVRAFVILSIRVN